MFELPPVVQLLQAESFSTSNVDDFFSDVKEIIPELRRQAEWSASNHKYIDDKANPVSTRFAVNPVSGINPFSTHGKCEEMRCRVKVAENFSRTIGLYSDVIYLPDPLTSWFIYDDDEVEWSDDNIIKLINEEIVLKTLSPLIENGVIEFMSPVKSFCRPCYSKFEKQIYDFSDQAVDEFWENVSIENNVNYLAIHTGNLHEPSLVLRHYFDPTLKNKRSKKKTAREIFTGIVTGEIYEHMLTMQEASGLNSTILSNSRAGLISLKKFEGKQDVGPNIAKWEELRTTDLPAIKDLTPKQIIELRESASKALPKFRELMYKNVLIGDKNLIADDDKCLELTLELRAQALEVKSELDSIDISSEIKFHNTTGTLGIAIALYSSAVGNPIAGFATLMATLGLIHTTMKKDIVDVEKQKSKPGFVLVKAQEILNTHN